MKYLLILLILIFTLDAVPGWGQSPGSAGSFLESTGSQTGSFKCPSTAIYGNTSECTPPDGELGAVSCLIPNIISNFEKLIAEIFSTMYCKVQEDFMPVVSGALTIFIAAFGVMFATGIVQFSAKEAMMRLFKIALVWTFATQADYGIGIAYKMLTAIPQAGMSLAGEAAGEAGSGGGGSVGELLQKPLSILKPLPEVFVNKVTDISGGGGGREAAKQAVFTLLMLFIMLMLFMPPIFALFAGFFVQVFTTFLRAFVAYLLAITGIAFLLSLSPIFLSFALFTSTYEFFKMWLRNLVSFSVQIVVLFAFLGLIAIVNPVPFISNLVEKAVPYPYTISFNYHKDKVIFGAGGTAVVPIDATVTIWSLCKGYGVPNDLSESAQITCKDEKAAAPITEVISDPKFIAYIVSSLVAFFVVLYILEAALRKLPDLAAYLSGSGPALGNALAVDPGKAMVSGNATDYFMRNASSLGNLGGGPNAWLDSIKSALSGHR